MGMRLMTAALLFLVAFIGVAVATGNAAAVITLPANPVTFYPDKLAGNGSFIMEVAPGAQGGRVSWLIPAAGETGYGQVPKVGGRWFCYFSSTDNESSCGPTPFTLSTLGFDPYEIQINVTTATDSGGRTITKPVGGMRPVVEANVNNASNADGTTTVYLIVRVSSSTGEAAGSVTVDSYHANLTKVAAASKALTKNIVDGSFQGSVDLRPGSHYLVFTAVGTTDSGGSVQRVVVPGEAAATVCAPAGAGGMVLVTGGGTEAVVTGKDGLKLATKTKVTNTAGYPWFNSSLVVPAELAGYLVARLSGANESGNLSVNDTATLVVEFKDIDRGMEVNTTFTILAWNGTGVGTLAGPGERKVVGSVPFAARVSFLKEAGPACPGVVGLSAAPASISASASAGEAKQLSFRVTNAGFDDARITSTSSSGLGAVTFQAPEGILQGATATVIATVTPASTGTVSGSLTVVTDQGTVTVPVTLTVSAAVGPGVASAKADLSAFRAGLSEAEAEAFASGLADAEADLNGAESLAASGDSAGAAAKLAAGQAKLAALQSVTLPQAAPPPGPSPSPTPTGEGLNPLVLVLVVVLIGLVAALFVLRKRKKGAAKEATFEEEAEEALKEPAEESEEEF